MMKVEIYQIKDIASTCYTFCDYGYAKNHGFKLEDYKLVYQMDYSEELANEYGRDKKELFMLDDLFEIFNIDRPDDFHGHSLSVSDIIRLNDKYYYCDSSDWVELKSI